MNFSATVPQCRVPHFGNTPIVDGVHSAEKRYKISVGWNLFEGMQSHLAASHSLQKLRTTPIKLLHPPGPLMKDYATIYYLLLSIIFYELQIILRVLGFFATVLWFLPKFRVVCRFWDPSNTTLYYRSRIWHLYSSSCAIVVVFSSCFELFASLHFDLIINHFHFKFLPFFWNFAQNLT